MCIYLMKKHPATGIIRYMNAFDIIEKESGRFSSIVIIGHIQPDGDCIGSSLGLKYLLKDNYGLDSIVVNQRIERFDFLGNWTLPGNVDYSDAFVIHVDNSTRGRSADVPFIDAPAILKIDHHLVVDSYGTWNVEEKVSSCSEIIARHAIEKGLRIGQDAARALYAGMVTDTGRFAYPSVDSTTFRVAATLLESGFDMPDLISRISMRSLESIGYIGHVYSSMEISSGGVVWLYVTQDVIDRFGLTPDKVSEALSCMRDIEGHPIQVLFADLEGKIRVEFRSDRIDIVDVARRFGGGGHAFACGARLASPSDIPLVVEALEAYMPKV